MKLKSALSILMVASAAFVVAGERVVMEAMLIRVNDRIVTVSDFRYRVRSELSQLAAQPNDEEMRAFATSLFDSVVDELVLLERAQEKNLTVEDEVVERAIAALRDENQLDDEQSFEAALIEAGLTMEGLRRRYRESMILQRVVQSEVRPTEITEEEIRLIYEGEKDRFRVPAKVEIDQLFFPYPEGATEQRDILRRVLAMVERVRSGADLVAEATLAGVELQDLGAIPVGDLRSELLTILKPLDEGELSDPIEITGGVQVIRLLKRIPAGFEPFEDVKEDIRRRTSNEAYQAQSQGLVGRLKADYLVEIHRDRLSLVFSGWDDVS